MTAGYETTSTTLSYCSFVLAWHKEEQEKLGEEIKALLTDEKTVYICILLFI